MPEDAVPRGLLDENGYNRAQTCLHEELIATINRCRKEFDLTPVDQIGVLESVKHCILQASWSEGGEDA
jgi:hypothetical protein